MTIDVALPDTIKRESHTLRQIADTLEKRRKSHNRKIREHLRRLATNGSAYVLVMDQPAKVVGNIGALRVQVEFLDGLVQNVKLETITECLTDDQFSQHASASQQHELKQTEDARRRLKC